MKKYSIFWQAPKAIHCSCRKVKLQATNLTNPSLKATWTAGVQLMLAELHMTTQPLRS